MQIKHTTTEVVNKLNVLLRLDADAGVNASPARCASRLKSGNDRRIVIFLVTKKSSYFIKSLHHLTRS